MKSKNDFIAALLEEISLQNSYLQGEHIDTIYFGGGTPSLLYTTEIELILERLAGTFSITPGAEVTLEANPDDLHPQKLAELKAAGINRLSIGVQSFFEQDLQWMNRAHNAAQSLACIEAARQAGFYNLTIDLIYGTPGLTDEKWHENVHRAIAMDIPHLSCYALTVEPKTALDHLINTKQFAEVDADQQARQLLLLMDWMEAAGYEHYEISNFAKPGWRSKHNAAYWLGKKYLGLGPSAHSFNGAERQWNVANNTKYIQSIATGIVPAEIEVLTEVQRLNEYIMTSLRTMEGLNIGDVANNFNGVAAEQVLSSAQKFIDAGSVLWDGERLKLTREGKLMADGIAAEMFFE